MLTGIYTLALAQSVQQSLISSVDCSLSKLRVLRSQALVQLQQTQSRKARRSPRVKHQLMRPQGWREAQVGFKLGVQEAKRN